MQNKDRLRKKYFFIRREKYFDIKPSFFNPLIKLIKERYKKKDVNLSSYYPASFEVNILKLLDLNAMNKIKIFLPVITGKNSMHFYKWQKHDVLQINKFGMLEPFKSLKNIVPNVMLIPLLAYDNKNNRLGYGGGFYDRYLKKYLKTYNNILTIGIAFSFQKYHKLPVSNNDVKLDYILTEKGIV
jgi:5-formyltetrahydrofolate cyclo-ligase